MSSQRPFPLDTLQNPLFIPLATEISDGFMSAEDKVILDNLLGLGSFNVIAPGLHGIVGNGIVDDAPAIRNYLNSLLTAVPGENINVNAGGLVRTGGNKVTVTYNGTTKGSQRIGSVFQLSPGEANFPAGRYVVTGLGFQNPTDVNPHSFTYTSVGANVASSNVQGINPLRVGAKVFVMTGPAPSAVNYRLGSRIDLAGTFDIEGCGQSTSAPAIFLVDAGADGFGVPNCAFGTIIKDIEILAAGKSPLPNTSPANTPGSTVYALNNDPGQPVTTGGAGSYAIQFNVAGDATGYKNGDLVRIEGGGLVPIAIGNLQGTTVMGQATWTYANSPQPIYSGMYAGCWLNMPGAWTRERVLSIDTVTKIVTMASTAGASNHFGAPGDGFKISIYPDIIGQIQSGGGTINITVEDDAIQPNAQSFIHHFHCGIYASTEFHFQNVTVQGFQGCGFVNRGSASDQPSGFAEMSSGLNCRSDFCGIGWYAKGVDANTSSYANVAANFSDLVGIMVEQYGATTYTQPVCQVAPLGHFVGGGGVLYLNPYSEGNSNAFGTGRVIAAAGGSLLINDDGTIGTINSTGSTLIFTTLGGNPVLQLGVGIFIPNSDNTQDIGIASNRWRSMFSYWYDTKRGAQLAVAANTITPTAGFHHVDGTGGPTIKTISATNVPVNGNVKLTLVADTATINYDATGNISLAGSIPVGLSQEFQWDSNSNTWYPDGQFATAASATLNQIVYGTGGGITSSANLTFNGTVETATRTAVGTAQNPVLTVTNTTAAALGAQQYSPLIELIGQGWKTGNNTSQTAKFAFQTRPIQASTIGGELALWESLEGASYSEIMKFTNNTPAFGVNGIAAAAGSNAFGIESGLVGGNSNQFILSAATNGSPNAFMYMNLGGLGAMSFRGNQSDTNYLFLRPETDNFVMCGSPGNGGGAAKRWMNVASYWYDTKKGSQLPVAANVVTPTSGFHHVDGTGGPTIKTIATTNVPVNSYVRLTLVADTATINYDTTGNIAGTLLGGTIPANTAQDFQFDQDTSKWYPVD